ncbi:multidrug DMT transporter [Deinococcus ruber]|nr:multidrug DMT transporter [Deinococcus ruber]
MDTPIKKAGAMLAHLDLFHHMLHVRGLLQLAQHMEERGDRVTMVSPDSITLMGNGSDSAGAITTSKGATIEAGSAYTVLSTLKGHEAPEYAVTREELKALNARAVSDIESGDAMRAFADTLTRITAADGTAPERPAARPRRGAEAEAGQVSAEN